MGSGVGVGSSRLASAESKSNHASDEDACCGCVTVGVTGIEVVAAGFCTCGAAVVLGFVFCVLEKACVTATLAGLGAEGVGVAPVF